MPNLLLAFTRQSFALAVLSLLFTAQVLAHDDKQHLIEIIDAIEQGWETADGAPFRKYFLDFEGGRYFESGGENSSLDDLIEHHVETEGDALADLELVFSNIQTHISGDFAWALADVEVTATVRESQRKIHNRGHEPSCFNALMKTGKCCTPTAHRVQ